MTDERPADLRMIGPSDCAITFERLLPGSLEQVWKYLTEPRLMSRWLAGATLELRVGGQINLDFGLMECQGRDSSSGKMAGIITELAPPTLLSYSWNEGSDRSKSDDAKSIVTFRLTAINPVQTKLVLTHTRVRRKEGSGIAAGWHVHLIVLERRILHQEPPHFESAWSALDQQYRGDF